MDPEYQKKLYEMLQGKQIEENLEYAMEEHPESFGQVSGGRGLSGRCFEI